MIASGVLAGSLGACTQAPDRESGAGDSADEWRACDSDDLAEEPDAYPYAGAHHGRVYVYHGCASGLGATSAWIVQGESEDGGAEPRSVASAGDVNGDGYGDVIIGAVRDRWADYGNASVYLGTTAGLAAAPAWTSGPDDTASYFGVSVASAGDVNGDGYGDVVVGAPRYENGEEAEGAAYVYLGSASGLEIDAAWIAESDRTGASFGVSVASAGDVNGDGFGDVVVGAYKEGRAYLYLGSASGLGTTAAWIAESGDPRSLFGMSVASAGDVNGDGYGDVAVGGEQTANGGRVYVYLGSEAGLGANATWSQESDEGRFGENVASAGDVNGDGYADLIVGVGGEDHLGVFLYLGSAAGLATTAAWAAKPDEDCAGEFGDPVASAGDVNGDGFSDVVVAARGCERAYVYPGSAAGLAATAAWTAQGQQEGAYFGFSLGTAGDVNGDGYGDIVVSARTYESE